MQWNPVEAAVELCLDGCRIPTGKPLGAGHTLHVPVRGEPASPSGTGCVCRGGNRWCPD